MRKVLGRKNFYIRLESLSVSVTGSCNYLLFHYPDGREEQLVIDCGMFLEENKEEMNRTFSFDCKKILAVLVTHEHADHCARIPCLFERGFTGKVYGSEYAIQKIKTDAMKNYFSMRREYKPELYRENDATTMIQNCITMELNEEHCITPNIYVTPLENAHTKGAVMYLIRAVYEESVIRVLFTGDYKRVNITRKSYFPMTQEKYELPITIVTEATHGAHKKPKNIFREEVKKAIVEGKSVVAVATGQSRFETIANEIREMKNSGDIPNELPVFIEFGKRFNLKNVDIDLLPSNVTFINSTIRRQEAIYEHRQKIIIATSRGNMDFFLQEIISNSKYLIFYTNYVSKGSKGDKLLRMPKEGRIALGKKEYVKLADVKKTQEYSDHDYLEGLIGMLQGFSSVNGIFLEHGDEESKEKLKREIQKTFPKVRITTLERDKAFRILENGTKGSR